MSRIEFPSMQRTTIRLNEHLLAQAKEYAVRERRSLTSVIEDALRALLAPDRKLSRRKNHARLRLPVSKEKGGFRPGINTWEDVKRVLEEEEIENFKRVMQEDAAARR